MVRLLLVIPLIASPFFFFGGPADSSSRLAKELWDCGHWLFFVALAGGLWTSGLPKSWSPRARTGLVLLLVCLLGGGIEIVQALMPGRQAGLGDFLYDMAGGLAGVLAAAAVTEGCRRRKILLALVGVILLACSARLFELVYDRWRVSANMPILADFESSLELERWQGDADRLLVAMPGGGQGRAMAVRFTTDQFSEIRLRDFPGDWHQFRQLKCNIYLPAESLALNIKIFDNHHVGNEQSFANRYNGRVQLQKGWNSITVPLSLVRSGPVGRPMDLARIKGFSMFVQNEGRREEIFFDNLRLE